MERETALRQQMIRIRETRQKLSLSQRAFSEYLNIPLRTIEDWEAGRRMMPDYVLRLILYKVNMDLICQKQTRSVGCDNQTESVNIVYDAEGKAIVLIDHLLFRSRRQIDWNVVEEYLKSCIGKYFEIAETAEKIYVGKDFPDEFSHSKDTKNLKGANRRTCSYRDKENRVSGL